MEVSKNNVSLYVKSCKKTSDIVVNLCFSCSEASNLTLKNLLFKCYSNHNEPEPSDNIEMTALLFSLYEQIKEKFMNTPLELLKSRVSNVSCNIIDNMFCITWNCLGNGSALRKTCSLAIMSLQPQKLYQKYVKNVGFLSGGSKKKEEFNYCVKKIKEHIEKNIHIVCVGKIKTTKDKLNDILNVIVKKYSKIPAPENKSIQKPTTKKLNNENKEHKEHKKENVLKVDGVDASFVLDYIRSFGMNADILEKNIIIYNSNWNSKRKQLKETRRIKDYVEKKYKKLGDEFQCLFVYHSLIQQSMNSVIAKKFLKSKINFSDISKKIEKNI
jgi:hypothetical protein